MIRLKLLVCDLDGTLMSHGENALNPRIITKIKELLKKGVLFACASGRTYGELKRIFKDEEIYYIPYDGAAVIYKDKILYKKPFEKDDIKLFEKCTDTVFHGEYISFVKSDKVLLKKQEALKYNCHTVSVESEEEIDGDIFKVSLKGKVLPGEIPFSRVYDGSGIVEFVQNGVNKGEAVSFLLKALGIKNEDLYVAGDNLNDISMFDLTENSFSAPGAKYQAIKHANRRLITISELFDMF